MGEVYRARDTRLDRDVALKTLPPDMVKDAARRERFIREAKAAAAEVLRRKPDFTVGEFNRFPYKNRKRLELGKSLLRKAGLPK